MSTNRTVSPIPLEMFQTATKVFSVTVKDSNGAVVDLSSMTLRFVVQDENNPPNAKFKSETVSGTSLGIATVTVDKLLSGTASDSYRWRLWDVPTDALLAHGPFSIRPAIKDVP